MLDSNPGADIVFQFLDPETNILCQFLDLKTDPQFQFWIQKLVFLCGPMDGHLMSAQPLQGTLSISMVTHVCLAHDLSKYTVPSSFLRNAVPRKVLGMLVVSAPPTKVVGMQAVYHSIQIQK